MATHMIDPKTGRKVIAPLPQPTVRQRPGVPLPPAPAAAQAPPLPALAQQLPRGVTTGIGKYTQSNVNASRTAPRSANGVTRVDLPALQKLLQPAAPSTGKYTQSNVNAGRSGQGGAPPAQTPPSPSLIPEAQAQVIAANNERGKAETDIELGRATTAGVADHLQGVTQGPLGAPQAPAGPLAPALDQFGPWQQPGAPTAAALTPREQANPVILADGSVQQRGPALSLTGDGRGQGRVIGNVSGQEVRAPALGNEATSQYGELPAGDAVLRNEATGETRSYTRGGLAQRAGKDVYTPAQAAAESQRRIGSYGQQTAALQESRLAKEAGFEGDPEGFAEYRQNKALKAQAKALGIRGTSAAAGLARGAKGKAAALAKPVSLDQVKAARATQLAGGAPATAQDSLLFNQRAPLAPGLYRQPQYDDLGAKTGEVPYLYDAQGNARALNLPGAPEGTPAPQPLPEGITPDLARTNAIAIARQNPAQLAAINQKLMARGLPPVMEADLRG